MGTVLAGVHGAPVTHRPAGGGQFTRRWIMRVYPDEAFPGEDRPVHSETAELRVPRAEAATITAGSEGDEIEVSDGTRYRITARIQTPNPGVDALIPFQLEEITL